MADIAITAASVLPSTGAAPVRGIAAVAIAAGKAVYKNTDGKFDLADANGAPATRAVVGVAGNSAGAGQEVQIITEDPDFTLGGTIALGVPVVLSDTPGGLTTLADLATGDNVVMIGYGKGSNKIILHINDTGSTVP